MPRLTRKGQVTIPRHIRAKLSVKTGDEVVFEVDQGHVVVRKKESSIENLKEYVGFLAHLKGKATDEIIDELRGGPDDCGH
jgi:AbrB family looped-hinge helix DNA binding protein